MFNNIIVRLVLYYVGSLLFFSGFFRLFPKILYYIAQERDRFSREKSLDLEGGIDIPVAGTEIEGCKLLERGRSLSIK